MGKIAPGILLLVGVVVPAAQQTLPSAPEPKPAVAPSPFKVPVETKPGPPAAPAPDTKEKDPKPKDEEQLPDYLGISTEPLSTTEQLILKDYLSQRLLPAIRHRWYDTMPEEAKGKRVPIRIYRIPVNRKGKGGRVRIAFTLHKDGSITDARVDNSSGDKLLDEAALNAVKAAKPGKMPEAFTRDALKARFNFLYNP